MPDVTTTAPIVNVVPDDMFDYRDEQSGDDPAHSGLGDDPTIVIARGGSLFAPNEVYAPMPWSALADSFAPALTPTVSSKSMCPVYILASLDGPEIEKHYRNGPIVTGQRRTANNAVARYGLTIDFDMADTTFQAVVERVCATGLTAVIHTSYNHLKTVTKPDDGQALEAALAKVPPQLKPYIIGKEVHHLPWPKIHVIIPFAQPWQVPREPVRLSAEKMQERANDGLSPFQLTAEGHRLNSEAYHLIAHEFAAPLAAEYDQSCADITRAIYFPAKRPAHNSVAAVYEYAFIEGRALNWQSYIDRAATGERAPTSPSVVRKDNIATAKTAARQTAKQPNKNTPTGVAPLLSKTTPAPDLPAGWNNRLLLEFEMASALVAAGVKDHEDGQQSEGKITITCPFADEHTDPSRIGGTYAQDASHRSANDRGARWGLVSCSHAHCKHHRTQDFIAAWLADGTITLDLFKDKRFARAREASSSFAKPSAAAPVVEVGTFAEIARRFRRT